MNVLVINCGSSSIKYQLFAVDSSIDSTETDSMSVRAKGIVERIGMPGAFISQTSTVPLGEVATTQPRSYKLETDIPTHHSAFEHLVRALTDSEHGAITKLSDIDAIGHRIVHGGDKLVESCLVNDKVIEELERCVPLAPLHTPAHLTGIREATAAFPKIPQVLVFDTAFHQTIPPHAAQYPLPLELAKEHKIRKYGFHGSSYRYVTSRIETFLNRPVADLKMVVCHLGNGSSMAAINGGVCVDTSMGLTPLEGLMMGTRTGDIDPAVSFYLERQLGYSADEVDTLFNKKSGLLGVSGYSQDLRDVVARAAEGDERCRLAVEMFAYRVRKYIGAYAAAMGGLDALVFTAGIGENAPVTRELVCQELGFLGVELDAAANADTDVCGERRISAESSKIEVLIIPTNEERVIVEDTVALAAEYAECAGQGDHVSTDKIEIKTVPEVIADSGAANTVKGQAHV